MTTIYNFMKASSSETAKSEELIKGIEQLNDSVYELYSPQDAPQVVIIFFHGLPLGDDYTETYWKTWLSRDGTVVWPKEWLPASLCSPWILSVSYDSYARKHNGASDSYTIVERLIQDIILDAKVGQDCPVVLVGHCLGGIIIKEFILECLTRKGLLLKNATAQPQIEIVDNFLGNCKGVFYYSTPHCGSEFIDDLAKGRRGRRMNEPLMKLLKVLSLESSRINSEFANSRAGEGIKTFAMSENRDTTYMGFNGKLVEEASSRFDIDGNNFYTSTDANHFDVCKPKNNTWCNSYKNLLSCIGKAIEDRGPGLRGRVLAIVVPEDYVPRGNTGSTSQSSARSEECPEINPLPTNGIRQPPETDRLTEGIKKVNGSLYELYAPPQGAPRVVVIFFHGLSQEDNHKETYWKTWLSRDVSSDETVVPTVVWPKEWLPEHLPSSQILSVSYDSRAHKHDGEMDPYCIAENLIGDIILARERQQCPVVLVGHSLGGIIIKEFLLACFKRRGQLSNTPGTHPQIALIENFLENCKGVFYYSTPHHGSEFIDYLETRDISLNGPLMELLKRVSTETARKNSAFANARLGEGIRTYAIRESLDTKYMEFTGKISTEASVRSDIDPLSFFTASDADHFDVCKATNKSCSIVTKLVGFIKSATEDKGLGLRGRILHVVVQDYKAE